MLGLVGMCETVLCPEGMTHIAHADQTQCDSSPCSETQCCTAGLSSKRVSYISIFRSSCLDLWNFRCHFDCLSLWTFFYVCLLFGFQRRDAIVLRRVNRQEKSSLQVRRATCVRNTNARKANAAPPAPPFSSPPHYVVAENAKNMRDRVCCHFSDASFFRDNASTSSLAEYQRVINASPRVFFLLVNCCYLCLCFLHRNEKERA